MNSLQLISQISQKHIDEENFSVSLGVGGGILGVNRF